MSSTRKTPEHAACGLLPTEGADTEAAADEAAADEAAEAAEAAATEAAEAAEEVAEAAEAAEEAAVSGLDPSGSASSSSSLRSRAKAAGELHRPRRDHARTISIRGGAGARGGRQPADLRRGQPHRRQHRQAAGAAHLAAVLVALKRDRTMRVLCPGSHGVWTVVVCPIAS